ncbi:hypothetical protein QCA50_013673 [Cerrena zonata]|uniref:DUF6697 domain-containing protein n=1 Tax=Cerrena zonata TaxID=2478898 RepID=A0AAW0G2X8_9APHY
MSSSISLYNWRVYPSLRKSYPAGTLLLHVFQTAGRILLYRSQPPPGSTLFLPQRVFWYCPEDIHGIALSPSALYRTRDQSWMENDEFTCLLDQTKEVFYRGPGKGIYYAGTFKCAYTGKLPTSDFRNLPAGVKEELIRTSFSAPEIHNIRTRDERAQLRKLYCDGERKVSFLALQCVGFNQKLYDAFLAVGQLREAEQKPSVSIGKRRRKGEMDSKRAAKMIRDERARSETEVTGDEPIV